MKKMFVSVVVVALAGAMAAAWWLQNRPLPTPAASAVALGAAASVRGPGAPGGGPGAGAGGAGGPAPVEVGKVERMRLEEVAQAVGSLRANQSVVLRPEVSGRIASLGFSDGQPVRLGQLLVQLDDTLQQAQLRQAEAQSSISRTNLQRSRELVQQNFVSQSAVDQNVAALEVALAQVALAQAQAARMKIVAPFDGIAGIRSVNLGDYVKDGADLVGIDDLSSLWVDFRLPERYIAKVTAGQAVELTLDALPDRRFTAKVAALDSQLDASGRSVLVRARLVNSDGVLRGGMFARARVMFEVRERALVVPEEALVPQGDKQFIVRVVDVPGGGKQSQRVEARIGQRAAGKVELLGGVELGDTVVLAGQSRLMRADGLPVRVVDLDRPAGGKPGGASSAAGAGSGASAPGRAASSPA
jgi:membrane fusion protein, multidrug efflux system